MCQLIREADHDVNLVDLIRLFLNRKDQKDQDTDVPAIVALGLHRGINGQSKELFKLLIDNCTLPEAWIKVFLVACDIRVIIWTIQSGLLAPEDLVRVQEVLPMPSQKKAQANMIFACHLLNECLGIRLKSSELRGRSFFSENLEILYRSREPKSLAFWARKEVRGIMRDSGSMIAVSDLPLPIQDFVTKFPDLNVEYAKGLYRDCIRLAM